MNKALDLVLDQKRKLRTVHVVDPPPVRCHGRSLARCVDLDLVADHERSKALWMKSEELIGEYF